MGVLLLSGLVVMCLPGIASQLRPPITTVDPSVLHTLKTRQAIYSSLASGLNGLPPAASDSTQSTACTYDDVITCDPSYRYRSFDGSCNNLDRPILGSTNTPFERLMTPQYEDGLGVLRETGLGSSSPLPPPREISVNFHEVDSDATLQNGVKLLCMEFGQFISHDINRNTISTAAGGGGALQCCNADGTINTDPALIAQGCNAISVSPSDPFFMTFNRQCLNFARAVGDTNLACDATFRQQKNRVTHFLDASVVYGSDDGTADGIRTMTDGLLETVTGPDGRELMKQSPTLGTFGCRSPAGSDKFCFVSGDTRVNQNPMLITVHTVFLREHNRVARALKLINSGWDDEKLYQEARRIVVAQYQHIVFKEYLPALISATATFRAGLLPKYFGYFTGYDSTVNPAIRNEFMGAGFRSGHSTIARTFSSDTLMKEHFFNPGIIYDASKGVDFIATKLVENQQQTMDRFKSDQITNHLFQFADGTGRDLASINIKRGRDHGLPSYNDMREFCGFPRAQSFIPLPGGLEHHTPETAAKLSTVYSNVDDIEAWTGISSEKRLKGGVFGPTAACITAIQFGYLKRGDRFYYENDLEGTRFTPAQLNQIRSASMARLLCDNTGISQIQKFALWDTGYKNPLLDCSLVPRVDLALWDETGCIGDGWSQWSDWTPCKRGRQFRYRHCVNKECITGCQGEKFELGTC